MAKIAKTESRKAGLPPGTIVHIGTARTSKVQITAITYDATNFHESAISDVSECSRLLGDGQVKWINVDGIHDVKLIEEFGNIFSLHPLAMEDIVNTAQRPKAEDYGKTLFVVAKMLTWDEQTQTVRSEQVSFILGDNFLLTFQEVPGDVFDLIRQRLRDCKGRIRSMGPDYLLYSLLDAIADYYFVVLENIGTQIEELEDREITSPSLETMPTIRKLKKDVITLRRAAWPMREIAASMERSKTSLIRDETDLYLRDLYDHSAQIIETTETYREMLSGVLEIYLSSMSNRMNEVMKVLTIIATIFIPLTFIAGIYGMNFDPDISPWNMPELRWVFGYPMAIAIMAVVAISMVIYFRRRKWL